MKTFITSLILCTSALIASAQVPEWIKAGECTGTDKIFCYTDITTDENNNIFSVGFSWSVVGSNNSDSKIIISKRTTEGIQILEQTYPITPLNNRHDDCLYSTTIAKVGNLEYLVSGGESNGNALLYSVKASNLNYINKANISGDGNGTSKIISVYSFNNSVYAIGTFKGNIKFRNPGQSLIKKAFTSTGIEDVFVAKFHPGCGFIDAIQLKGEPGTRQHCFDLKIDNNENLYFSIATSTNINVNNQPLYSGHLGTGKYDLCIIKLNKLLPVSCNKITEGPQADFEINTSFFSTNLPVSSFAGAFLNSFNEVYFPITLSNDNLWCHYAISFIPNNGPNVVGKFNIQNNISTFSQTNSLFPNNSPNSVMVTDLDFSLCDSIYLSVLVYPNFNQHAGVFYHRILSMSPINFTVFNGLSSSGAKIRGSKISIDKNRNILFAGFFEGSSVEYNNDYNTQLDYGTNCQVHSLCQAYTIKYNPCQSFRKKKQSIISGPPILCEIENTYWEYSICGNCGFANSDCTYKLLPIGTSPDPQISLSHYFDPILKKVMIAYNPNYGTYNYPFKLYVECRVNCFIVKTEWF
jgi:hypothetical protein